MKFTKEKKFGGGGTPHYKIKYYTIFRGFLKYDETNEQRKILCWRRQDV